jgi:hypothetical protein
MAIKMFLDRGISPYIGESAVLQQTERKKFVVQSKGLRLHIKI